MLYDFCINVLPQVLRTQENFGGEKLAIHELFASPIFKFCICTDFSFLPNFSLPIACTCMVYQNFPAKIFTLLKIANCQPLSELTA